MKHLLILFLGFSFLLPMSAIAETEEEEMARIQRELNKRVFGLGEKKPEPAPVAATPAPVAKTSKPAESAVADILPVTTFTKYKLAGLHLTMEENAVLDSLKASGYACNVAQAQQMARLMGGARKMCIYISQEAPKWAIVGFTNGQLLDLETHEMYRTEFPEEFFKRARDKFMASYSETARCKAKKKGEVCEVFGHGYRILFRTEKTNDGAKIIHRVGRI